MNAAISRHSLSIGLILAIGLFGAALHAADAWAAEGAQVAGKGADKSAKGDDKGAKGAEKGGAKGAEKGPDKGEKGDTRTGTAAGKPDCPGDKKFSNVRVTNAFRAIEDAPGKGVREVKEIRLRKDLVVEVQELGTLWDQARCQTPEKKIILYLDGRAITNVTPEPPTDPKANKLIFPLRRDEKSRDAWTHLLGYPKWDARETRVSVGLEDQYAVPSSTTINLEVIPKGWLAVWSILFLFLLVVFLGFAARSDVLRVTGPDPATVPGVVPARKMFSLSRVQAAWWFFLILASYLFIGMITGDYSSTITGTVLVLAGISSGTTLGAVAIDAGDKAAKLTGPVAPRTTGNWLQDILSDASGVSFHRFQMAVWTLVLGIVFVTNVYRELAMPVFSETLLGLLGISAGTYLGMKIPEAKETS
jgi:hypothetical protein